MTNSLTLSSLDSFSFEDEEAEVFQSRARGQKGFIQKPLSCNKQIQAHHIYHTLRAVHTFMISKGYPMIKWNVFKVPSSNYLQETPFLMYLKVP